MVNLRLDSPLDSRARDAALAYFAGSSQSITATAARLGVKRDTAVRRLERAHTLGWVVLHEAAPVAGPETRSRVCRWRVWWTAAIALPLDQAA